MLFVFSLFGFEIARFEALGTEVIDNSGGEFELPFGFSATVREEIDDDDE